MFSSKENFPDDKENSKYEQLDKTNFDNPKDFVSLSAFSQKAKKQVLISVGDKMGTQRTEGVY